MAKFRQSFRMQLLTLSLVVVSAIVGLFIWMSATYLSSLNKQTTNQLVSVSNEQKELIESQFSELNRTLYSLAVNPTVHDFIIEGEIEARRRILASELIKFFQHVSIMNNSIRDIYIESNYSDLSLTYYGRLGTDDGFPGIQLDRELRLDSNIRMPQILGYTDAPSSSSRSDVPKDLVMGSSIIRNFADSEISIGNIYLQIDLDALLSPNASSGPTDENIYRALVDTENSIIYAGSLPPDFQREELDESFYESEGLASVKIDDIFVVKNPIDNLSMDLVTIRSNANELFEFRAETQSILITIVVLIILLILFMYWLYRDIASPIEHILNSLRSIRGDDFYYEDDSSLAYIPVAGNADMQTIAKEYNLMLKENNILIDRLMEETKGHYDVKLLQQETELSMLKTQINHHFLYNSLEVIRSQARLNGETEIAKVAVDLSRVLRYSIQAEDQVTIGKELEILQSYVDIENARFNNIINLEINCPLDIRFVMLPKLSLQPIVENSINHGLLTKMQELSDNGVDINKSDFTVHLNIYTSAEENVHIDIWDNGVGLDTDKVQEILDNPNSPNVGMKNVDQRMKLMHGENCGIFLPPIKENDSCIELKLSEEYPGSLIRLRIRKNYLKEDFR